MAPVDVQYSLAKAIRALERAGNDPGLVEELHIVGLLVAKLMDAGALVERMCVEALPNTSVRG